MSPSALRFPARALGLGAAVALAVCPLLTAPVAAQEKLPAPTGRVSYKMAGGFLNGTMTFTWAEGGKKFRQDTNATMGGPVSGSAAAGPAGGGMSMNSWTMGDGKYIYTHVPLFGPNQVNRVKLDKAGAVPSSPGMPSLKPGKKIGKVVGKETIAGKPCEIRETTGEKGSIRISSWQNLPLKTIFQQGPVTVNIVATKIELNTPAKPALFKVPVGMKIVDGMPNPGAMSGSAPGGAMGGGGLATPKKP